MRRCAARCVKNETSKAKPRTGLLQHGASRRVTFAPYFSCQPFLIIIVSTIIVSTMPDTRDTASLGYSTSIAERLMWNQRLWGSVVPADRRDFQHSCGVNGKTAGRNSRPFRVTICDMPLRVENGDDLVRGGIDDHDLVAD